MRILSITAQKPDSTGSGVYLTELVKGFAKSGCRQAVIAGIGKNDKVALPGDVMVYPVHFETKELPFPVAGMSDEMPYKSTRYCDMNDAMTDCFTEAFRKELAYAVEDFGPDVILCHHLYYLTALVREMFPEHRVYGICHGSDLRQIKKNPWKREFIRERIVKLNGIMALHDVQKASICEFYGCGEEQVHVIGTGYNSSVFYTNGEAKPKDGKIRLLFAGKISEKKGVISLIKALSQFADPDKVCLNLAGGAGCKEEYDEIVGLAEACPCNVRFLGRLSHEELAKEMNRCDVFVLPSFYEGLPLVVVEAMACGMKVVCTDLPGIREWIDANIKNNGIVFVTPPRMHLEDEPVPEDLPAFEKELACAILAAPSAVSPRMDDVRKISWNGLCGRLIEIFDKQ